MIAIDENALICDLAETYHIYDYRSFKPTYISILAVGLRDDSRIKLLLSNQKISLEQTMLCAIYDRVALILWLNTQDGQKGRNMPKSVLKALTEEEQPNEYGSMTIEEFNEWRNSILKPNKEDISE